MRAGMIDEVLIIDAGRTRRHAGQTGQAAVDMADDFRRRRPIVLEHLLDQVDAPARTVELVAQQQIGRAGRRAEPAVHALANDGFAFANRRSLELLSREFGSHRQSIRPGFRRPAGSKAWRSLSSTCSIAADGGC